MKKSRLVLIAFGIVAFLGLIDRFVPQGIKTEREDSADGYRIIQTAPVRREFQYDSGSNMEWLFDYEKSPWLYVDHDCNGVDAIYDGGCYHPGYPNTEKMFKIGNKYFQKVKREIGAE